MAVKIEINKVDLPLQNGLQAGDMASVSQSSLASEQFLQYLNLKSQNWGAEPGLKYNT